MAWYSFLTSTSKTAETAAEAGKSIVDGLVSGIDAVFYTDEEKAQARQKGSETILRFWEAIARENTEQSKARRMLAKMTFQVFFFFLLAAAVVYRFDAEYARFLLALAGKIMFLVSAIGVIYFGPHQLQKIVKK
ncbi:MAG: hypothetical protein SWH54_01225 [Thermodesulfobacteriota bacterium]|nr:hypothetical protein [Thermodesulfobacteriota bacterium]